MDVYVRLVGIPDLVAGVRGHGNLEHCMVGARQNGPELGARVGRVLDAKSVAALAAGLPDGQDQVDVALQ